MLILEHLKILSQLTELPISGIKPVRFGFKLNWSASATVTLASCLIPDSTALVVLRTECYVVNLTSGAADYGYYQPPPPGTAWWLTANDVNTSGQNFTDPNAPTHLVCDTDELIFFPSGRYVNLVATLEVSPDGATRAIRTTCYGYYVPAGVVDRLANQEDFIRVQT